MYGCIAGYSGIGYSGIQWISAKLLDIDRYRYREIHGDTKDIMVRYILILAFTRY